MQHCSVCDPMKPDQMPAMMIATTQVVVKSLSGGDGCKRKHLNKKLCRWRRPAVQKVDFIGKRDWSAALCEKSEGCGTIVSGTGNRNQSTEGARGKKYNIDPQNSFIII